MYDFAAYQSPGGTGGAAGFVAQDSPAAAAMQGAVPVPPSVAAAATGLSFNTGQNPHIPPVMPLEATMVTHAPITTPIAMPDGEKLAFGKTRSGT